TTPEILDETGFEMEIKEEGDSDEDSSHEPMDEDGIREPKLENYAIEELEKTLQKLIDREEYEEAARVAEILKRKRDESQP
ncbi:MAG: UvrB/UvrC motif-containing protein, partial [Duncaniella dubosii]|nr:UvrB/UvrC motif-containing protein [Duncaniella dubosii]